MAGNSKNIIKHWLKKCVFIIIIFICLNIIIYFVQLYRIKKYPVKVIKRKYTQDFFVNRHKITMKCYYWNVLNLHNRFWQKK